MEKFVAVALTILVPILIGSGIHFATDFLKKKPNRKDS